MCQLWPAQPIQVREACTVCQSSGRASPTIEIRFHPAVIAVCDDHSIEVGFTGDTDLADVTRTLELLDGFEEEVVSVDPGRVRVSVPRGADALGHTLDDEMNEIDVSQDG